MPEQEVAYLALTQRAVIDANNSMYVDVVAQVAN
jgi:hypothetical protein